VKIAEAEPGVMVKIIFGPHKGVVGEIVSRTGAYAVMDLDGVGEIAVRVDRLDVHSAIDRLGDLAQQ
jgi:hypothetical protein